MRPVIEIAFAAWFLLFVLSGVWPPAARAQERDAFDVDIIPAASKHLGVVHEWGFERVEVSDLVALTEKRGQGRAAACSGRDCSDRQATKRKPAPE